MDEIENYVFAGPLLGIPLLDYGLVDRWLAYLARGRFRHDPIAGSPPVQGERLIGWTAHYLIGIAVAAMLLAIWGLDWARHPTIGPALIIGIGSVAAPFLLMQPGMGVGVAASRTPRPAAARLHSLVTPRHARVFRPRPLRSRLGYKFVGTMTSRAMR